tara:strand:- start:61 stop:273 length:213 start_codon:yes stop_codon:yes gene_type:complete
MMRMTFGFLAERESVVMKMMRNERVIGRGMGSLLGFRIGFGRELTAMTLRSEVLKVGTWSLDATADLISF